MSKKAQLTIFIILAIAIVAVLLVLFLPRIKTFISPASPENYVKGCIEDKMQEDNIIERISLQGGSLEPKNYILYQSNKVDYVCYTDEYLKKCMMQKPVLKQEIESEINGYVAPVAESCINKLKKQLEDKGSSVSLGKIVSSVSINPDAILIDVNAQMSVTKEGTSSYNKFRINIQSKLYDLIMISSSIANWEARYGDSESMAYMLYYPNIKVEKKKQGDGSTIYILTHRISNDKFQFASRSLVIPEGYR